MYCTPFRCLATTHAYNYPALARGRSRVCLCQKRHLGKIWPKSRRISLYATCRITFMFTSAVVLETAVSTIHSATCSLLVQYAVFFRVLPCVIAAPVYYAVFFRVRLLLSAYYDSLVPNPGSRSRLQPRAQHRAFCTG